MCGERALGPKTRNQREKERERGKGRERKREKERGTEIVNGGHRFREGGNHTPSEGVASGKRGGNGWWMNGGRKRISNLHVYTKLKGKG